MKFEGYEFFVSTLAAVIISAILILIVYLGMQAREAYGQQAPSSRLSPHTYTNLYSRYKPLRDSDAARSALATLYDNCSADVLKALNHIEATERVLTKEKEKTLKLEEEKKKLEEDLKKEKNAVKDLGKKLEAETKKLTKELATCEAKLPSPSPTPKEKKK
jgi:hypothetical protein